MMEHGFARIDASEYKDYNVYVFGDTWLNNGNIKYSLILDENYFLDLRESKGSFLDKTSKPARGCDVNIIPKCSLPFEDIRKNYKVKRGWDTGDYNVFSPNSVYQYCTSCQFAIIPSRHAIILNTNKWGPNIDYNRLNDCIAAMLASNNDRDKLDPLEITFGDSRFYWVDLSRAYYLMLMGSLQKPCVPITSLSINTDLELTNEALYLTYETGRKKRKGYSGHDQKDIDNFIVELNALNNYNWREYPGTISLLMNEILSHKYTIKTEVRRCMSRYSKTVKNLIKVPESECISEKDFNMAKSLLKTVMNIGDKKFVRYEDIVSKLNEANLSMESFAKYFSTITKMEEKKFHEN